MAGGGVEGVGRGGKEATAHIGIQTHIPFSTRVQRLNHSAHTPPLSTTATTEVNISQHSTVCRTKLDDILPSPGSRRHVNTHCTQYSFHPQPQTTHGASRLLKPFCSPQRLSVCVTDAVHTSIHFHEFTVTIKIAHVHVIGNKQQQTQPRNKQLFRIAAFCNKQTEPVTLIGGSCHECHFCCNKGFVATNTGLSRQNMSFVMTKACLLQPNLS